MKPVLDKLPNIMLIAIFRAPSNGCYKICFTSDLLYKYFFFEKSCNSFDQNTYLVSLFEL